MTTRNESTPPEKPAAAASRRGPALGLALALALLLGTWAFLTAWPGRVQAGAAAPQPVTDSLAVRTTVTCTLFLPAVYRYYDGSVMPYGVQIDGSLPSTVAARVAEARVRWVRVMLTWSSVQPTPGTYNWSAYDSYLGAVAEAGLRPIVTIAGNPGWAAAYPCGPISPTHMADFTQFVDALVRRYSSSPYNVRHWEFYNEPDNTDPVNYGWLMGCWGGHGDDYAAMLKAVYPVVKAADPNAQVVFGGLAYDSFTDSTPSGPFERRFLDDVIDPAKGNAGAYFDVMNFHFYKSFAPAWEALRPGDKDLEAKANYLRYNKLGAYGVTKPFICTETSMWSGDGTASTNYGTDELQSRYVAQSFMRGLAANLDVVIWYCMTDYSTAWQYGLLRPDLSRKPSFGAYQTVTSELPNVRFLRELTLFDTGDARIEGYEFIERGTNKRKGAVWTNVEALYLPIAFPMDAPGKAIRWVEMIAYYSNGAPNPGSVHIVYDGSADDLDHLVNSQVTISVGPNPIYVSAYP
jgi:hypothetical protein